MTINLSFVISTRNRLPFLQITLENLIKGIQPDEEIVVVDGNSTDGTQEYLQRLLSEGKIHQYISEPDKNQSHGWNKAFLMARGTIIKKVIDDDVLCYQAIRRCKEYMLANPAAEVVISNDLSSPIGDHTVIHQHSRYPHFKRWRNGEVPSFTFGDVHMLIRRSALAFIGLYNTGFVFMDYEYSLRISSLNANIVYYTGYNALTVGHPNTVSSTKQIAKIVAQGARANYFYDYAGDAQDISLWSKIKIGIGKRIYRPAEDSHVKVQDADMPEIYRYYYARINELNDEGEFKFIGK